MYCHVSSIVGKTFHQINFYAITHLASLRRKQPRIMEMKFVVNIFEINVLFVDDNTLFFSPKINLYKIFSTSVELL